MYESANNVQRNIIDTVLQELLYHNTGSNVFCLTAHAGKTFVQTVLIYKLNSMNIKCIPSALSGIASTLLIGGRTLHNVFKLPINLVENSVSSIKANSSRAQKIKNASLFIVDETSMCPLYGLMVIRLMKDICQNDQLFGEKTILLCGDFRQTLPVISHGTRVNLIENCIKSWTKLPKFQKLTLTQNMRALPNEIEFVEFLRKLGNGELQTYPQFDSDIIEIPAHLIRDSSNIIEDIYGNVVETIHTEQIWNSVILAPKNDDCAYINNEILSRMPGEEKTYSSFDKIISDDD